MFFTWIIYSTPSFVYLFQVSSESYSQFDLNYFVAVASLGVGFGDITANTLPQFLVTVFIMIMSSLLIAWATLQLSSSKLNEYSLLISYNEKIMQVKNAMTDLSEDIKHEKMVTKS